MMFVLFLFLYTDKPVLLNSTLLSLYHAFGTLFHYNTKLLSLSVPSSFSDVQLSNSTSIMVKWASVYNDWCCLFQDISTDVQLSGTSCTTKCSSVIKGKKFSQPLQNIWYIQNFARGIKFMEYQIYYRVMSTSQVFRYAWIVDPAISFCCAASPTLFMSISLWSVSSVRSLLPACSSRFFSYMQA